MKFLADCTLGKLVLWLRILGYDAECSTTSVDRPLLNRGLKEKRIVLTRRRDTAKRNYAGILIVLSADRVWDQLAEMRRKIVLEPLREQLFSRCLHCNDRLQPVVRSNVEGRVPPYIFQMHHEFQTCLKCGRIFWPGTHRERMLNALAEHSLIRRP